MESRRVLTADEFRRMQLIQMGMVRELDRVCRANNINYVLFAGTLLGAVRHKGYIPWDDDADIAMLREDYEKFKLVAPQLNQEICFFQDHTTDPEYRWGYGKLRRTGTKYIRIGQEHIKCKTGISIDVFPLDDVPLCLAGQMWQDFYCYCMRKILWSEAGKKSATGLKRIWFSLISNIPVDWVYRRIEGYVKRSRNSTPNRVRILLFNAMGKLYVHNPIRERYGMPKEWFLEREVYDFEGSKLYGTKDYDACLRYIYKDYMTLPPVEKREQHAPVSSIDFGNIEV